MSFPEKSCVQKEFKMTPFAHFKHSTHFNMIAKERQWRNFITARPLKNCKVKPTKSHHASFPMYKNKKHVIVISPLLMLL